MPRRKPLLGPNTRQVIEDAPLDLAEILLAAPGEASDALFTVPASASKFQQAWADRGSLSAWLERQETELLTQFEDVCRRIVGLGEGKGATSLRTIAERTLSHEEMEEFDSHFDDLGRSIWAWVHHVSAFQNAESFYHARQYRGHVKCYSAFELAHGQSLNLDAEQVDREKVAAALQARLGLTTAMSVSVIDLPETDSYAPSVMLVARHGAPLSSVYHHGDDGSRSTVYYRPQDEVTLIYSPSSRSIEVCTPSTGVRYNAAQIFAEVVLGLDLSKRPLQWRDYDHSRFQTSFDLPVPDYNDCQVNTARVVQADVRLGTWSRHLSLRVGIDEDIGEVADRFLGGDIFKYGAFSKIAIAVEYEMPGAPRASTLRIELSDGNRANVAGLKDPVQRHLGQRLLKYWGIQRVMEDLEPHELRETLLGLLRLNDYPEDTLSGDAIEALGLSVDRLLKSGHIDRTTRQAIILVEDDDEGVIEAEVHGAAGPGQATIEGGFGCDGGQIPRTRTDRFKIRRPWLQESVVKELGSLVGKKEFVEIDTCLTIIGQRKICGQDVSLYLARRLADPKVSMRLDGLLRAQHGAGPGIVLALGTSLPHFLGRNVVIDIGPLIRPDELITPSGAALDQAFTARRGLAAAGQAAEVRKSSPSSGNVLIPQLPPLFVSGLHGLHQLKAFERLVEAANHGVYEVHAKDLTAGSGSTSPSTLFSKTMWSSIKGRYIFKGNRGHWRLGPPENSEAA